MNHYSLNTSAIFVICMGCGSSIHGIFVTKYSAEIPRAAIDRIPYSTVARLNYRALTGEQKFWRFGVHMACFLGGLSVY